MISEPLVFEWVTLLLRWLHVITALAWIGASFYLISWENKFNRVRNLREGIEGDFWTIQGGDFYFVEKLRSAPAKLPEPLHWFKYEAYFTWLSGFALMCFFYFNRAESMMLDPGSPLETPAQAIAASLVSLIVAWALYSLYCATRWARNLRVSALIGVLFVALLAGVYSWLFNGRTAFLHAGIALGTIMSANVFFVIIPWHKRLVRAIQASAPTEALYRAHPGFRSRHNHYMTLPVLFLMMSTHAPINFDARHSWLVMVLMVLSMGLLKHFHSRIQRRQAAAPYLVSGLLVFGGGIGVSLSDRAVVYPCDQAIAYARVETIVADRCSGCHNASGGQVVGANGKRISGWMSPEQLLASRAQLLKHLVEDQSMPPANITGMTSLERNQLACWLTQAG